MKDRFMKDSKENLLRVYSNTLINLKNKYPKNTVPILEAICGAFTNLYYKSHYQFQKPDDIIDFFSKNLKDSVCALAASAYFEYKLNYLTVAEDLFSRAVKIDPDFAEAQWYLGVILKKLGKDTEAEIHHKIAKPFVKYWVLK